jgi:ABC-type sugar transport system substrate-binding protein
MECFVKLQKKVTVIGRDGKSLSSKILAGAFSKKLAISTLLAGTMLAGSAIAANGVAAGDASGKKIVFSSSFAGNSFRQVMIRSLREMGVKAKADG